MADRGHRAKRFKACKVRVHTQSTRGKKTTRSVRVKATTYHRPERTDIGSLASLEESNTQSSMWCRLDTTISSQRQELESEEPKLDNQGGLSKHHQRRVKEESLIVRESLLKARIEEEAFSMASQTCVTCAIPAICRCVDCGPRQYFCLDCAKMLHNERNYFHILETYKVRK